MQPFSLKYFSYALRILLVILIAALAWHIRSGAVAALPVDYDEDDYMRAAQEYALVFRSGDLGGLTQFNYRPEHPPLVKMAYGLAIVNDKEWELVADRPTTSGPNQYLPRPHLTHARTLGAVFNTLTIFLLGLLNPLAAFFLSIHALTVKYTSQMMLESLPALTSLLMVMTYQRARRHAPGGRPYRVWLALSAVFLGLTAASKYLYAIAGVAILVDWMLHIFQDNGGKGVAILRPYYYKKIIPILAWGLIAIAVFFIFNPYLWPDPLGRLRESVFYHATYSTTAAEVQNADYPFYQPFIWLFLFSVSWWHPQVFPYALDVMISITACFGLALLWKNQRVYGLWLALGMFFLLIWPTKWPQYIVTIILPISLAAGEITQNVLLGLWNGLLRAWRERNMPRKNQTRAALPWLTPGLLAFAALTLFPLLFQAAISLTDFNSISIRDGLNGGITRAVWGGLTGQAPPANTAFPFQTKEVQFVGLQTYLPVLQYLSESGTLSFNILWTLLSVGLQTILGVAAALLLWNERIRFRRAWQALFILPWAIPETIGALMWFSILHPIYGWLALAVRDLGPDIPFAWLKGWNANPGTIFLVLLTIAAWYGFPFIMLAASAGLKLLPAEVLDAAAIDGASPWQTLRYVTWPLLWPLVLPAILVRGIFAFNQFYLFQVFLPLYARTEGAYAMQTLATVSYNFFNPSGGYSRINGQFAVSAAINLLTMLMLIVFVVAFNRRANQGSDTHA